MGWIWVLIAGIIFAVWLKEVFVGLLVIALGLWIWFSMTWENDDQDEPWDTLR